MTSILFVEDDYYLGPLMVAELESKGYDVYFAQDYSQACDLIDLDGPFDVLLTDYEFPGGNGLDVIAYDAIQLDELEPPPAGLVVIWSGLDRTQEVQERGLGHRVNHILTKGDIKKVFDVLPPA
jgi:CheY-like chemotaxis protein